jgi:tetratricopeptide (TPR) repeat protein
VLPSLERETRLVIHAFRLPLSSAVVAPEGTLVVRNTSGDRIDDGQLSLTAGNRNLGARKLPAVAAGQSLELAVPLTEAAALQEDYLLLTAAVTYRTGAGYERISAVAPFIRESAQADESVRSDDVPAGYAEWVREGVLRHNVGDWLKARDAFLRAHRLYPNARTLRALGMVEFDLGDPTSACNHLQLALEHRVRPLSAEQRREVRRLLVRLRGKTTPRSPFPEKTPAGSITL